MNVKFTDLYKLIKDKKKIFKKIINLIKNSKFVGGKEVERFEKIFCKSIDTKYCVAVGNGTDALEISIKALGLKKNSEIIVPTNTWISTAEAVVNNGHKLVFCDVNLKDYSICLNDLKKKINKNTKAIIPVHLYGIPTNVLEIKKIIKNRNIKIVEDCAQSYGAKINKKSVGSFGDVGCFSFFPGKNLGAFGDGGAIVTNSKKIYLYAKRERNHGALLKYDHKFSGRNSRLDTIHAAVLSLKLKNYRDVILKRNKLANIYYKKFKKLKKLETFNLDKNKTTVYHQFVIRTNKRDLLRKFLNKNKIQTMIHYPYMLNELSFFKYSKKLLNSYNLGKKILSLPISEEHTEKEINYVAEKVIKFFKNHKIMI